MSVFVTGNGFVNIVTMALVPDSIFPTNEVLITDWIEDMELDLAEPEHRYVSPERLMAMSWLMRPQPIEMSTIDGQEVVVETAPFVESIQDYFGLHSHTIEDLIDAVIDEFGDNLITY